MRPIRLILQAFGPFGSREVVNFENTLSAGLFGIYGPTGAGKTSIFDGLCFALFGQSAGAQREGKDFRSDHAADNVLTQVELIFDLGEKRYSIKRIPVQERISKRGKKPTQQMHQAWLFDATGLNPDEISENNQGKPIAEKKISLVEQSIQDLLGYSAEQFRQIILLPQGQFRRVLDANTKERSTILQNLFDVSLYERLQDVLKSKAETEKGIINKARIKRDDRLEQSGFESFESLEIGIKNVSEIVSNKEHEAENFKKANNDARSKYEAAKSINDQFVELEKAKVEQIRLEGKQASIDDLKTQLETAKSAEKLIGLENNVSVAKRDLMDAHSRLEKSAEQNEIAEVKHKNAQESLQTAQKNAKAMDSLNEKKTLLKSLQEILHSSNQLKADLQTKTDLLSVSQLKIAACKNDIELLRGKVKTLREKAAITAQSTQEIYGLEKRLSAINLDIDIHSKLTAALQNQSALEIECKFAKQTHAQSKSELDTAELRYQAAEKALSDVQAIHLANHLVSGEDCPVCGSKKHPRPAKGKVSSNGLNQSFESTRNQLQAAQKKEREKSNALISLNEKLNLSKQTINGFEKPIIDLETLTNQKQDIEIKIAKFQKLPTLESILKQQNTSEMEEKKLCAEFETLSIELLARQTAYDSIKALYDSAISKLPPEYQENGSLEKELYSVETKISNLKTALEEAIQKEREMATELANTKTTLIEKQNTLARAEKRSNAETSTFEKALNEAELNFQNYTNAKTYLSQKNDFEDKIEAHKTAVIAVKTRIEQATRATASKQKQDLTLLQQKVLDTEKDLTVGNKELNEAHYKLKDLNATFKSVEAATKEINKLHKSFAPLGEMAELTNGSNPYKLKLVDFAIAAMYDDVLAAANLRLGPMTDGRFELQREAGVQGGRAYRGLDTLIFDSHTETLRPSSSLSGGEGFLASLALALGLSDVVQAQYGGVRLDALFIDEGFGSLDPDTLDLALETLQSLADNNRMVGIISHVEEVKRAIPNGFTIVPSSSGSHIKTRHSTH